MKALILIALAILFCNVMVLAGDGFRVSFFPNLRAPSLEIAGTHTIDLSPGTFSIAWSAGLWTYIGDPPTGYGRIFYVLDLTPRLSVPLRGGWIITVNSLVEYRTNLPNRMTFAPEISFSHEW